MLTTPMQQSPDGEALTQHCEGLRLIGYPDKGIPAVGWGHRGPDVVIGQMYTLAQCQQWYAQDIAWRVANLNKFLTAAPPQGVFDSLCDAYYNIVPSEFEDSTLLRLAVAGNYDAAWNELPRWCKFHSLDGTVHVDLSLLKRRRVEQAIWKGLDWRVYLAQADGKPWWPLSYQEAV